MSVNQEAAQSAGFLSGFRIRAVVMFFLLVLLMLSGPAGADKGDPDLLLLVYMTGSDLESSYGSATADLAEMSAALPEGHSVEILVMAGGSSGWKNGMDASCTGIYSLTRDGYDLLESLELCSMGEPETLTRFLRFGKAWRAAGQYALILWDHGAGPMAGVCFDENYSSGSRPDSLTLEELRSALAASPFAAHKLSWIGFDACLMAAVETAWTVSPYAEYMIASQETEPVQGWDYRFLAALSGEQDGAEAGRLIIDRYADSLRDSLSDYTLSCVALGRMQEIADASSELFRSMKVTDDTYPLFTSARVRSRSLGCSVPYDYDLVDYMDLLEKLQGTGTVECGPLISLLKDSIVHFRSSRSRCNGLSLYYPYANKPDFSSPWSSRMKTVNFAPGYTEYISEASAVWMRDPLAQWKSLFLSGEQQEDTVLLSMTLTPEQAAQTAGARLTVISEPMPGRYFSRYASDQVVLQPDGRLECLYRQESLYMLDSEGVPQTGALGYLRQDDYVFLRAFVNRYFTLERKVDEWIKKVWFVYRQDENGNLSFVELQEMNPETGVYGKSGIRLEDWDFVTFADEGYRPARNQEGQLLPFSAWGSADSASGYDVKVENIGTLQFIRMQDSHPRFAMLEVTDLQNHTFASELIPLYNPNRHDVGFSGVRELQCKTFSLQIESITLVSGNIPCIQIRYSGHRNTENVFSIDLSGFSLNGVPVGETLFGSGIRMRENDDDAMAARIEPAQILATGQTVIHSIEFTVYCRDRDWNILEECPVRLELELDAREIIK